MSKCLRTLLASRSSGYAQYGGMAAPSSTAWYPCSSMQRKHAAASVTRCTIHLPPTAVGEGDYGIPCAGQSQGSPISHRSIWESLRHSESGTHLLGVHAELEITLANGHMYIHIQGFINKTRAATLSLQPRFHQQGAGSHAFLSVKVSSTRRGQPRFHSSRVYQQVHSNKYTFPHGGPVHFLPLLG